MAESRSQQQGHLPTPPPNNQPCAVVHGLGWDHEPEIKEWVSCLTGDTRTEYTLWTEGDRSEPDELYWAMLPGSQSQHTLEQIEAALENPFPTDHIFPMLPIQWATAQMPFVTVAEPTWDQDAAEVDYRKFFLKRPNLRYLAPSDYDRYTPTQLASRISWQPRNISHKFALEIRALERLARCQPQHPNLVRYYGCRVRQGRITGILLHRVEGMTLAAHVLEARKPIDKERFMATLISAVDHLHNVVGIAHNDIHMSNIMVSPDGTMATLIDLGSAEVFGERLFDRAFSCLGHDPLDMDFTTLFVEPKSHTRLRDVISRRSRDLAAVERVREWLDNPSFDALQEWDRVWSEAINASQRRHLEEEQAKKDAIAAAGGGSNKEGYSSSSRRRSKRIQMKQQQREEQAKGGSSSRRRRSKRKRMQ